MEEYNVKLHLGDCIETLRKMEADSVDAMVTDPPAGISFMGKEWDKSDGFIPFMREAMSEALRVLKPGAHAFVWAIPRTSHWTATACEEAGFEIRDVVTHVFGSGFPKSLSIDKAIDKAAGAQRERVPIIDVSTGKAKSPDIDGGMFKPGKEFTTYSSEPITPDAKRWQGFGTALKPASEHWILVRKPLSERTVAANVLKHGTGGINIDASRIGNAGDKRDPGFKKDNILNQPSHGFAEGIRRNASSILEIMSKGRFPANLVLSHNPDCVDACTPDCAVAELDRQSGVLHARGNVNSSISIDNGMFGNGIIRDSLGNGYKDSGGASRFFYCAKASKRERNEGCEGLPEKERNGTSGNNRTRICPDCGLTDNGSNDHSTCSSPLINSTAKPSLNHHPTVKPKKLMSYLITMITPPNGVVLDPFMGSGSTGVAALESGFRFIGIEREQEYFEIAKARIFNKFPEFKKQVHPCQS